MKRIKTVKKNITFCLFNYADTLFLYKLFGDWILMPIFAAIPNATSVTWRYASSYTYINILT